MRGGITILLCFVFVFVPMPYPLCTHPVEENWDSEEEAEVEAMGDGGIGFSSVSFLVF